MIKAEISNCNNILSGTIQILKNQLNIRYATNGTGKSTIASAIDLQSKQESLSALRPFDGAGEPTCSLSPPVNKVLIFNEEFVNSFVFQQSEVIQNAFEVFIKTPEYEKQQDLISQRLKSIHLDVAEHTDIQQIISAGRSVLSKFAQNQDGTLRLTGHMRSLINSESIFELPEKLIKFQPLMDKDYKVDWVGWKQEGSEYDDTGICPFCTSGLSGEYQGEKELFQSSYTKSNVKNIIETLSLFDSVEDFMDESKRKTLYQCIKGTKDEREIKLWLQRFVNDLKFLVDELSDVEQFNSFRVQREDISNLDEVLKKLIIDISNLEIFNNQKVKDSIDFVNQKINAVLSETELLKNEIGQLKGLIGDRKQHAITDINDFLTTAGINYKFEIRDESEDVSKTVLSYISKSQDLFEVSEINLHLSWGEKNAFALVLFMHYALSQEPELIILDDPISSFDNNKKYAIISRLFSSKRSSFYRKTVLMLTHDLQPVIDYVINDKPTGKYMSAYFFQNKEGVITEQEISESDIKSLPKMLAENAKNADLNKIHRVASLRKFLEHVPDQGVGQNNAYNLLSCLLHGKTTPTSKDDTTLPIEGIESGEALIKRYIPDFTYAAYSAQVFTKEALLNIITDEQNTYFRLQAFRVLLEVLHLKSKISDDVLMKYIDEQFHVENDYMFTLDFVKYDTVPDFVIPKCLEFLRKERLIS